jgi:branched-chain amino acid transport system permease protein
MDVFLQQLLNGIIIGMIYSLMAVGLTLIFGILKVLNFAHGQLYMLGAFGTYYFYSSFGMNYFLSLVLSIICVSLLGILFERITIEPLLGKDLNSAFLTTFALGLIIANSVQYFFGATPKNIPSPINEPIQIGALILTGQKIFIVILSIILIISVGLFIKYTRLGKILRATSQNQLAATFVGINSKKVFRLTFMIATGLSAMAGSLLGPIMSVYPTMGSIVLIKSFVVVILGGLGSLSGAIYGGLFLGIIETLFGGYISSAWKDVLGYFILVLVLIFMPEGIGKRFSKVRGA